MHPSAPGASRAASCSHLRLRLHCVEVLSSTVCPSVGVNNTTPCTARSSATKRVSGYVATHGKLGLLSNGLQFQSAEAANSGEPNKRLCACFLSRYQANSAVFASPKRLEVQTLRVISARRACFAFTGQAAAEQNGERREGSGKAVLVEPRLSTINVRQSGPPSQEDRYDKSVPPTAAVDLCKLRLRAAITITSRTRTMPTDRSSRSR